MPSITLLRPRAAYLHFDSLIRNGFERVLFIDKLYAVIGHKGLILLGHCILRLCKYADKILALERGERSDNRQSADKLGYDAELEQIMLLSLLEKLADVALR